MEQRTGEPARTAVLEPDGGRPGTWVLYVARVDATTGEVAIEPFCDVDDCLGSLLDRREGPHRIGLGASCEFSLDLEVSPTGATDALELAGRAEPGRILASKAAFEHLPFRPNGLWQAALQPNGWYEVSPPPDGPDSRTLAVVLTNGHDFLLADPESAVRRLDRLDGIVERCVVDEGGRYEHPIDEVFHAVFADKAAAERAREEIGRQIAIAIWDGGCPPVLADADRIVSDDLLGTSIRSWRRDRSVALVRQTGERSREAENLGLNFNVHGSSDASETLSRSIVRSADTDIVKEHAERLTDTVERFAAVASFVAVVPIASDLLLEDHDRWSFLGWALVAGVLLVALMIGLATVGYQLRRHGMWGALATTFWIIGAGSLAWWMVPTALDVALASCIGAAMILLGALLPIQFLPRMDFAKAFGFLLLLGVVDAILGVGVWRTAESQLDRLFRAGLAAGLLCAAGLVAVVIFLTSVRRAVHGLTLRQKMEAYPAEEELDVLLFAAARMRLLAEKQTPETWLTAIAALTQLAFVLEATLPVPHAVDAATAKEVAEVRRGAAAHIRWIESQLILAPSRALASTVADEFTQLVNGVATGNRGCYQKKSLTEEKPSEARSANLKRSLAILLMFGAGIALTAFPISSLTPAVQSTFALAAFMTGFGMLVHLLDPHQDETDKTANLLNAVVKASRDITPSKIRPPT